MIEIKMLFFASYRSVTGTSEVILHLPDELSIFELKKIVGEKFPTIKNGLLVGLTAMNQEYVTEDTVVTNGSEVAFFPPVSGGSGHPTTIIKIVTDPIDIDSLTDQITYSTTGAVCIFTGVVRGITGHGEYHETSYLEYEAYIPMAESKMQQVASEIREQWPSIEGITIIQRIGKLFPQTLSVVIACSAAHRNTGIFSAAKYGIDRLKEIVPVWKKETGPGGEYWVEGDYHSINGD